MEDWVFFGLCNWFDVWLICNLPVFFVSVTVFWWGREGVYNMLLVFSIDTRDW